MPYIRRDNSNAKPNAQVVYADPETEKLLAESGFIRASGAPYYNRGFVNVIVFDDGTWEPSRGEGFLPEEWQKMREFAGVQLKDFSPWLKQNHEFIEQYCANLKPDDYRKEETFTFVKVYKHGSNEQEYAWFIQHFSLLGSDGVIPADKKAIPRQYWFINGGGTNPHSTDQHKEAQRVKFDITTFEKENTDDKQNHRRPEPPRRPHQSGK
jgi:hypothetical protein